MIQKLLIIGFILSFQGVFAQSSWISLFDGKTLNGWRGYKNRDTKNWVVEKGGVLHCANTVNDKKIRADLITTEMYQDVEWSFEWKISKGGNSGVMFRVSEDYDQPYFTGPEYQLCDDNGFEPPVTELQKTGANYDMHPNAGAKPKPVGQWNTTRIVLKGKHVEHWLNGKKALEYELHSPDWNARKEQSKWKTAPDYGMKASGYLALQDHGSPAWFRKIKIRKL